MKSPELIVTNADIRTMDPLATRVAALAVTDGRVSALGTTAEIAGLAGAFTRIIDAGGRLVYDIGAEVLLTLLGGKEVHRSDRFLPQ